jgi:hypothetical protein
MILLSNRAGTSVKEAEVETYPLLQNREKTMRNFHYRIVLAIWAAIAFQGSGLWAREGNSGDVVQLGDLKSRVPADWLEEKPDSEQYLKQYRLVPVLDDKEDARLTIRSLKKGSGDSVEKQVRRWKEMFLPPQGKTLDDVVKVQQVMVKGTAMTYLDVRGDYKGIPGNPATPRENFRLLGVYFATPQGPYSIRLFGPADTVEFYREEFEKWVKAFK